MKKKYLLLFIGLFTLINLAIIKEAKAERIEYTFEVGSSKSTVNKRGEGDDAPKEKFKIAGSFKLFIDDSNNSVLFENINISIDSIPRGFNLNWNNLYGAIGGANLSLSELGQNGAFINVFIGTFEDTLFLQGTVYHDKFEYQIIIDAIVTNTVNVDGSNPRRCRVFQPPKAKAIKVSKPLRAIRAVIPSRPKPIQVRRPQNTIRAVVPSRPKPIQVRRPQNTIRMRPGSSRPIERGEE